MSLQKLLSTYWHLVCACIVLSIFVFTLPAQAAVTKLSGPEATQNLLQVDETEKESLFDVDLQKALEQWKASLKKRTGISFGVDYTSLGYLVDNSGGQDDTASGALRLYGTWDLVGRDGPNRGGLVVKAENRHRYGSVAPQDFGNELGYVGLVSSVFSDQGWRVTNLYWQQQFAGGEGVALAGWLDVSDFVDIYALASPWRGFSNLAFQTGSGSIGGIPDGALGAMVGGMLSDNVFAIGSVVDANGDATDIFNGFDTLFDEGETFKSLELGWTSGANALFVNNAHLTVWQIDERTEAGTDDGHGAALSYTHALGGAWLPFVRGGWAEGGGSLYETSLSVGFGYSKNPGVNLLAVGVNWSRPNDETFGVSLDDQVTIEVFKRWQLTKGAEITPSVQIIQNPALNPDDDLAVMLGLRLRMAL